MNNDKYDFPDRHSNDNLGSIEQITPLARRINCLDIERIADICTKDIPKAIGAKVASLYILDEDSDILHLLKYNHSFLINKIVSINQTPPTPMVVAVRSKELVVIQDIDTHKLPRIKKSQRQFSENYQTKACIIVPLMCQERVVGVLNLADKINDDAFSGQDIAIVELLCQLVGASIGNIKLFERIHHQAKTDGLTGLVNHKTFYEILERELKRSQRYGGQISMIMIDIDNLKEINDTYGHRAGDRAIKTISRVIKECIRQIDVAARYGGDEFAVIVPSTQLEDALMLGQRMVSAIANSPIRWEDKKIELTISVGLGQYDANCCPEDITKHSDEALYCAKQNGKNQVSVFKPVPSHGTS